jgi:hypothetical protein
MAPSRPKLLLDIRRIRHTWETLEQQQPLENESLVFRFHSSVERRNSFSCDLLLTNSAVNVRSRIEMRIMRLMMTCVFGNSMSFLLTRLLEFEKGKRRPLPKHPKQRTNDPILFAARVTTPTYSR